MWHHSVDHEPCAWYSHMLTIQSSADHPDALVAPRENIFSGIGDPWNPSNMSDSRLPDINDQMFQGDPMFDENGSTMLMEQDAENPTSQSEIVKTRLDRVDEQYGNLTPPEEGIVADGVEKIRESRQSPHAKTSQKQSMDRSERARNAAMQRHAKSRRQSVREIQHSETESEGSHGEANQKRDNYREKNRAAAAKCRAKKKNHVGKIEQDARSLETENAVLKARVRELRNQHAELRDLALQHNPSVATCRCGSLHRYNMSKAAEITSSFSAFANMRSRSGADPHHDHSCTIGSSESLKVDRSRPMLGDSTLDSTLDSQGYDATSNFAFAGIATPESMQSRIMMDHDDRGSYLSGYQQNAGGGNLSRAS